MVARAEDLLEREQIEAPKNSFQEISFKNQQQASSLEPVETSTLKIEKDDDEPVHGKMLFRMLLRLGMKSRMARKVLKTYDHALVEKTLERVAQRSNLDNPAGYVICELKDGGYETEWRESPESASSVVSRLEKKLVKHSDAPIVCRSVWETKAENERLEAERVSKEARYIEEFKALYVRFQGLTEGLKSQLKAHWTEHLERTLPNTPRKQAMRKEQTFQRLAFKEVTERFFALVDEGMAPEGALLQMVA